MAGLLDVPYVNRLEEDAPAVIGCLDHALRNSRHIDQRAQSGAGYNELAKPFIWMSEHLLRVHVCGCFRSKGHVPTAARLVLEAANLDDKMDPGDRVAASRKITTETELRDRVRFVKLRQHEDRRVLDTMVACFEPDDRKAKETQLCAALKDMDDPPPRPPRMRRAEPNG